MSHERLKKHVLTVSLLIILVLSAASFSQAQQWDANQPEGNDCPSIGQCPGDFYPTSEPVTMLLFATGLILAAVLVRRRLHHNSSRKVIADNKKEGFPHREKPSPVANLDKPAIVSEKCCPKRLAYELSPAISNKTRKQSNG